MELTHETTSLAYKHARILLKNRRDIDPNDLAHDAIVKMATCKEPPAEHRENKIRMIVLTAFRDHYTNKTTRKHNVMLDAVHAEFEMETYDPDTITAIDAFLWAMKIVHQGQPSQCEILMLMLDGMTVPEIARMRGTSTQAVYEIQKKARITVKTILADAA